MLNVVDHRRPNVFEIDLDAIAANVHEIRRFVGPGVQIFAAMKANGYGFGLLEVAPVLQESGVDAICVADLSDAVRLRASRISLPILLYGGNLVDQLFVNGLEEHSLWATITDLEAARSYSRLAHEELTVFVKVDVGLERLGVPVEAARDLLGQVVDLPRLHLEGIYTHLHVPPGDGSAEYVKWQLGRFDSLLTEIHSLGITPRIAMAASSPMVPVAGACGYNGIDVGRLIYGSVHHRHDPTGSLLIQNAFGSLRSCLIQCKTLRRTDYLAQSPFPIRSDMWMGIVPIGYADGLDSLNCGFALVHGRRAPLLASPSLEHTRLDLSDVPEARVGDEVVFVGCQEGAEISPEEILDYLGLGQPTRMAAAVRDTVRRIYRRGQA